jgi:hypothetical protein
MNKTQYLLMSPSPDEEWDDEGHLWCLLVRANYLREFVRGFPPGIDVEGVIVPLAKEDRFNVVRLRRSEVQRCISTAGYDLLADELEVGSNYLLDLSTNDVAAVTDETVAILGAVVANYGGSSSRIRLICKWGEPITGDPTFIELDLEGESVIPTSSMNEEENVE